MMCAAVNSTKKDPKRRSIAIGASDLGSAERANHGGVVLEDRTLTPGGVVVAQGARAKIECRLDWYWSRGLLLDRLHDAGLRFRSLWEAAARPARVTASYGERSPGGSGLTDSDARADLRSVLIRSGLAVEKVGVLPDITLTAQGGRLSAERGALVLTDEGKVVADVAGMDEWASGRLPQLRDGLKRLADHWRIEMG